MTDKEFTDFRIQLDELRHSIGLRYCILEGTQFEKLKAKALEYNGKEFNDRSFEFQGVVFSKFINTK